MNLQFKHVVMGILGLAVGLGTVAEASEHSKRREFYGGPVVMRLDLDGAQREATAVGGGVGVNLKKTAFGTFSIDTFFSRTVDAALGENNAKVDVNNAGLYVAYRTPHKVFGMAKAGMLLSNLSGDSETLKNDKTGAAVTLGVGAEVLFGIDVEASYTHAPDNLDVITLGIVLSE